MAPSRKKITRSASIYYLLQGFAVFAWWACLWLAPPARALFRMGADDTVLLSFWLPDLVFLCVGSLLASFLCWTDNTHKRAAAWFVTGLVTYATFYTFAFALKTDTGWLGVVFMVPATIWSGIFAIGTSPLGERMFRPAAAGSTAWILLKTFAQIFVMWAMILGVFPYLIQLVEPKLGIAQLTFPYQGAVSAALFLLMSGLGIYSAIVMVKVGKGTPLPMDHATEFVVAGPYTILRNPMATSGIAQGLVSALFWGSPLAAAYALMGSLVWQLILRPLEEDDLEQRFGAPYRHYRENVKCWVPRLRPYRSPEARAG